MSRRRWSRRILLILAILFVVALAFVYVASHNGEAMFEQEWGIEHLDAIGFKGIGISIAPRRSPAV